MVKIQVNSQGKAYLTTGGKALVASSSGEKYGTDANTFLGDVNANGVLQLPTEQSDLVFTGIKDVVNYGLYYKFTRTKVKSASFPALTTISGSYGCNYMFSACSALTSISLPNLTIISGSYGCQYMFSTCTALASASFPALTTISGSYGCNYMFSACSALTSISLPNLTIISGSSGCYSMFYNCTALTSISLPNLTIISGSYGCSNMFNSCIALTDVYFPALTTTSFGSYKNQFNSMMSTTGTNVTHTLHFPSNLESKISGLTGYPLFGGTSGYVVCAFDLPATS